MSKPINNRKVKKSVLEIPQRISRYVKKYFDEANLYDIKKVRPKGLVCYELEIITGASIYRMMFDKNGLLIEKVMEPLFDSVFDETGVGD